jgi:hypothetical protein
MRRSADELRGLQEQREEEVDDLGDRCATHVSSWRR